MEYKWQTLNCHNLTPFLWVGFYNINVHTGDPTHDHLGNSTFILGQRTKIMGRVHSRFLYCWGHGIINGIWSDGKYDHLESRISIRIQMVWGEVWGITPTPYPVELLVRPLFSLIMQIFSSRNLIILLAFTTVIQNGFARTMIANTLGATSEIVRPVEQTNRFAFKR